jgi:pantetheine-phosphate adenylyltransferase
MRGAARGVGRRPEKRANRLRDPRRDRRARRAVPRRAVREARGRAPAAILFPLMARLDPRRALFPGTFDPVTLGHLDVLARARVRFDEVVVAIASHPTKKPLFTVEERIALALSSCSARGWSDVRVEVVSGLVVDAARALGCGTIVRGVRRGGEFDYEAQLALGNRHQDADLDTVLFVPDPRLSFVASSLVREIASLGGDVTGMAPPPVVEALLRRFARRG